MSALPDGYQIKPGGDAKAAQAFLSTSVWAEGISLEQVQISIDRSVVVSVWLAGGQVAMARVLTDYVELAYLTDVYVLPEHEGQGLASAMLAYLHGHPDLQGVGRWALFTRNAQRLYEKFGWKQYPYPERMMVIDPRIFAP
ncbi:MAG: GNAT family N-acetyltransferase [Proteobacteria bacterium]|nr:GNAT family N-acetyltransferase [Pseudomonadota bacterium]